MLRYLCVLTVLYYKNIIYYQGQIKYIYFTIQYCRRFTCLINYELGIPKFKTKISKVSYQKDYNSHI